MKKELKNILMSRSIVGAVAGFLIVALPLYLLQLNLSIESIGYLFGIAMIFYGALSFYFGANSEQTGRLWVGILSISVMILSLILFGLLPLFSLGFALVVFVFAKILFNLSDEVLKNIIRIRILDFGKHKTLANSYGWYTFADSLGMGVGLIVSGIIISFTGLQLIFIALAVLLLLATFFFSKSGDIKKTSHKKFIMPDFKFWKTSRLFKIILVWNTLWVAGVFIVDFFGLPIFQSEVLKMPDEMIFIIIGIAWLIYGLLNPLGGKLYDKYKGKVFITSLILIAAASIALAFAKDVYVFAAILFLDFVFYAVAEPARLSILGIVSHENKGRLFSIFTLFAILGSAVLVLFFGKIIEFMTFESIFYIRGAVHIISIFFFIYVAKQIYSKKKSLS